MGFVHNNIVPEKVKPLIEFDMSTDDGRKRTDYGVSNMWNLLQNYFELIYLNMYVLVSRFNNVYWKTLTVFNTIYQTIIKTLIKTTPFPSPCR